MIPTEPITLSEARHRVASAQGFLNAARLVRKAWSESAKPQEETASANAMDALAVLSGMASADAICGKTLGVRLAGEGGQDVVALLWQAQPDGAAASLLEQLLAEQGSLSESRGWAKADRLMDLASSLHNLARIGL